MLKKSFILSILLTLFQHTLFNLNLQAQQSLANAAIHQPQKLHKGPTNEATLVKLPSGDLKVFFINRPGKADKMMSIRSTNQGWDWSEPKVEFDLPGEAYYANQLLVDKDGTIHCIFHLYSTGNLGYRGRQLDLWYTYQKQGKNWEKPKKIWEGYVGSLRGFLQLKNGSLLIPMSESDTSRAKKPTDGSIDYGLFQVITLRSTDLGKTWIQSPQPIKIPIESSQVTRYGAVEPNALELTDGRIWMLIRTNKGRLYETFSINGGLSWEEAKPSAFISSDSPAGLLRLSNGKILLLWNSDQRYDDMRSYANGGREALHAAVSNDEGQTWIGFREVMKSPELRGPARGDRGTAYPSAVEVGSGQIVFVSGQGQDPALIGFNADWLEENNLVSSNLSLSDSTKTLVWNFPFAQKGEINISMELPKDVRGIGIGLTNHFSASIDTLATKKAPVYFFISAPKEKLLHIKCQWGSKIPKFKLYVNGKKIKTISLKNRAVTGFNYLRLEAETINSTLSEKIVPKISCF